MDKEPFDECTIFLGIDGVFNYYGGESGAGKVNQVFDQYRLDKTPEFISNFSLLSQLLNPNIVCCSTWRFGRSIPELNGIIDQVLGVDMDDFQFNGMLRNRSITEDYGARGNIILDWVASHEKTCKYWLVIAHVRMEGIPDQNLVQTRVDEGFSLVKVSEAFGKLVEQGGY